MQCKACGSHKQAEFNSEINVHFPRLKNLDKPAVFVFPKLLLCLDCGFTEFTLRESELLLLDETRLPEKDSSNEGDTDAPKVNWCQAKTRTA
jgi:hypothetical protein